MLYLPPPAFAADIAIVPWTQASAPVLRSFTKAGILALFNQQRSKSRILLPPLTAADIAAFGWADVGKGHYRLVVASSGPCAHGVEVYKRGASGKVKFSQSIDGFAEAIRPLNGNGEDDLIIGKELVEFYCASIIVWPAVYRFENGKYVEASSNFPAF